MPTVGVAYLRSVPQRRPRSSPVHPNAFVEALANGALAGVDVVIMASMLGGSKRQGTQRVGRVMRPLGGASAYLLATQGSSEEEYAREQMDYLRERGTSITETARTD